MPHSELTRRKFLQYARGAAVVAGGVILHEAMKIPELREEPYSSTDLFFIEKELSGRPPFFTDHGHFDYLGHVTTNHKVFNNEKYGVLPKVFGETLKSKKKNPRVGDQFDRHMYYSKEALQAYGIKNPSPKQIFHTAATSFAAMYSPLFSLQDIHHGFKTFQPVSDAPRENAWFDSMREKLPTVYPMKREPNMPMPIIIHNILGTDRIVHFASHTYLSHQLKESLDQSFQDCGRMPQALTWYMNLFPTNEEKVRKIDEFAGWVWEMKEGWNYLSKLRAYTNQTYGNQAARSVSEPPFPEGVYSVDVNHDYRANKQGTDFALALSGDAFTKQQYEQWINRLNSNEVNRDETRYQETPSHATRVLTRLERRFPRSNHLYQFSSS